jgi:uroporphyrin-3 C-methyltransferase
LLVRADRARFDGVQRAISLDLDRLRSVPLIDITQLSSRLETLSALVARAPLLLPDAAAPLIASEAPSVQRVPTPSESAQAPSPALTAAEQTWWQRALDQSLLWSKSAAALVVREFAGVVSIQRVSDANALMMSPEQGALLRANLRTRVLTAQMALLMNQAPVWRAELAQVQQSLVSRFDPKATDTIAALRLVQELAAIQIAVSLPSIKDSLSALESVRSSEPSPAGGQ